MSLKDQLFIDLKGAMKAKDSLKKNTIQSVRAGVLQVEKDKQIILSEDEVIAVVVSQVKKRKASLPDFIKSGREDLISELKTESKYLKATYLNNLAKKKLIQ